MDPVLGITHKQTYQSLYANHIVSNYYLDVTYIPNHSHVRINTQ